MDFLRINTIIGIVLAILTYGVLALLVIPSTVLECREEHKTFADYMNECCKDMYDFKTDKSAIVWILIMLLALIEAIFVWEIHYPFIVWFIVKTAKEEDQKNNKGDEQNDN